MQRVWWAAVAFAGHVPGLKIATRVRLTPRLKRVNVVAAVATLVAMAIAYFVAEPGGRGYAVLIAWLVGHFAWSITFSSWILMGGAVVPEVVE